ncbi:RNA-directed DNA polymerase, eukaryota [Tanacetum coccineum]
MAFKSRSNADHTRLISKSIFITNFPDVTTSKDLWVLCQSYGTVVDVFIPNRMSKAGKRFAFVRFIKVDNVERLVGNLCTLWIGRKHLQANVARFDRDSIPSKRVPHKFNHVAPTPTSFVSAVKGVSSPPIPLASSPAFCFKIIVKGKVFQIRAKELFVWSPSFKEVPEVVHCSDDESVKNEADINVVDNTVNNEGEESDSEAVFDTFFWDNGDAQEHDNEVDQTLNDKEASKDPFNIYDLLNRHKKEVGNSGMESSIPYPPGFTPEKVNVTFEQEKGPKQEVQGENDSVIRDIRKEGGSILDILDEMIKVGQTMGFTMDGCTKDMEKIIGSNGGFQGRFNIIYIVYAATNPYASKCQLWDFIASHIISGNVDGMVMGDFINEQRFSDLEASIPADEEIQPKAVGDVERTYLQTAFLPNRQILDGPFIINEILARCKHKNQQAMFFKVDFAKAYDSIRWDYLDDVLNAFGFGSRCGPRIQGSLNSGKASVLVNGSPTSEFQFHRGLKQGDPLAPFLFILIMESLHLSFNRAVEAGIFTGLRIDDALTISHLFYADDAIFIGEWSKENLKAAASLGCSVMKTPFNYLGIMVGGNMSLVKSWDETVTSSRKQLSKWKLKTLSIGGLLTLLKSVLGSTPIYNMSIFKVPKTVLNKMENLRIAIVSLGGDAILEDTSTYSSIVSLARDVTDYYVRASRIGKQGVVDAAIAGIKRHVGTSHYGCIEFDLTNKVYKKPLHGARQKQDALQVLHDLITSKRYRAWHKTHENIVFKYIELICVNVQEECEPASKNPTTVDAKSGNEAVVSSEENSQDDGCSEYLLAANMARHTTEAKAIFFDDAATELILRFSNSKGTLNQLFVSLIEPPIEATGTNENVQGRRLAMVADKQQVRILRLWEGLRLPERPTSSYPYDMSRVLSQAASAVDEVWILLR